MWFDVRTLLNGANFQDASGFDITGAGIGSDVTGDPNIQAFANDPTFGGMTDPFGGGSGFDPFSGNFDGSGNMFDPNSVGGFNNFNPASPASDYAQQWNQQAAANVGGQQGAPTPQAAAQQAAAESAAGTGTPPEQQARQIQIQNAANAALRSNFADRFSPTGITATGAQQIAGQPPVSSTYPSTQGASRSISVGAPSGGGGATYGPSLGDPYGPSQPGGSPYANPSDLAQTGPQGPTSSPGTGPTGFQNPGTSPFNPANMATIAPGQTSATPVAGGSNAPANTGTPQQPDQTAQTNQPGGRQGQRRGNPIEQLFRQLGLPSGLAQLAMMAMRMGMMGGGRGRRGGFPGMMPGMMRGRGRGRFGGRGGFPMRHGGMMDPRMMERFAGRQQGFPNQGGNQFGGQNVNDLISSLFGGDQSGNNDQTSNDPNQNIDENGTPIGGNQATPPGGATSWGNWNPNTPAGAPAAPAGAPSGPSAAPASTTPAAPAAPATPTAAPPPPGAPAGTPGAPFGTAPPAPGSPPGAPGWPLNATGQPMASAAPYAPPAAQKADAQAAATGQANDAPAHVLQGARQAALLGDPIAVARWMAQNGHPRSGAWCGEFAAAVMHSQGLPTPRHPEVASNWRNWGRPVRVPRPGDVAVRRGTPTGQTGSHVTIVESVDPRTGTMTVIGGNQGRIRRRMSMSGYSFQTLGAGEDGRPGGSTLYAQGVGM